MTAARPQTQLFHPCKGRQGTGFPQRKPPRAPPVLLVGRLQPHTHPAAPTNKQGTLAPRPRRPAPVGRLQPPADAKPNSCVPQAPGAASDAKPGAAVLTAPG